MMFFPRKPNLDDVSVAAPCPSSWEGMEGDDKVRYCSLCSLNVYNLSGMTRKEGEALMQSATGPLCIRLFRRQDGTLITKDCPVGRRIADACKRRVRAIAMALFACVQTVPAFSEDTDEHKLPPRAGVGFPPNNKWHEEIPETHPPARWGMTVNVWQKEKVQMPRGYAAPSATQGGGKQSALNAFKSMFGKPMVAKAAPLMHPTPTPLFQMPVNVPDPLGLRSKNPAEAMVTPSTNVSPTKADRSVLDAYNEAQRAESTGFTSRAAMRYEFAIYQFIRDPNAYDPVFKKQVALAYAKFLKKQNQQEQAKAILDEFCKN